MKARLNGKGAIEIDVTELSDSLSDDERDRFAQSIVFQEALLSAVVGQLVTGQSFDGWYIGDMADRLREQLLPIVPVAMRELVKSLLEQRDTAEERRRSLMSVFYSLKQHWPREVLPNICESTKPEYCTCPWKQSQVEAFLTRELGQNWEDQCRSSATEGAKTMTPEPRATSECRKLLAWLEAHPEEAVKVKSVEVDGVYGTAIHFHGIGILSSIFAGGEAQREHGSNYERTEFSNGCINFIEWNFYPDGAPCSTMKKVTL